MPLTMSVLLRRVFGCVASLMGKLTGSMYKRPSGCPVAPKKSIAGVGALLPRGLDTPRLILVPFCFMYQRTPDPMVRAARYAVRAPRMVLVATRFRNA